MVNAWEFSYNGLTFGGATDFGVYEVVGLTEPPNLREDLADRVGNHGGFSYIDLYEMRRITISGDLAKATQSAFEDAVQLLKKTFYPQSSPQPLVFDRPGFAADRRVMCKPSRFSFPMDTRYNIAYGDWSIQLVAEDPIIYVDTLQQATLTGASGSAAVNNSGDFPVFFEKVRLTGPYTDITFRDQATPTDKVQLTVAISGGQYVDVDFQRRTVIKSDGTNLYDKRSSDSIWFDVTPGSHTYELVTTGGSGATQAVADWRSGWL